MSWDDYRYFLSVARTGQLSLAGKQLGVNHTTVARRIKSLEEFLNAKLFDRSPRGYALTRAGER
ncbi:MAG: LysR family transcriptional regulator, partial [Pseudomonadota bacterium]